MTTERNSSFRGNIIKLFLRRTWWRIRGNASRGKLRGDFALKRFLRVVGDLQMTGKCLDVGCGKGEQLQAIIDSEIFGEVHALNLSKVGPEVGESRYFGVPIEALPKPESDDDKYDAIWCCHVLEHTLTPGPFLQAIYEQLKDGGVLCIIVPPLKSQITHGHVTLWNPGLLLLNLLKAGFDCKQIAMRKQGYNIAAILRKKPLPDGIDGAQIRFNVEGKYNARNFLPDGLTWIQNPKSGKWYYEGDFKSLNWN